MACAGDPFAVLADVDRARMPDLLRLIKRSGAASES